MNLQYFYGDYADSGMLTDISRHLLIYICRLLQRRCFKQALEGQKYKKSELGAKIPSSEHHSSSGSSGGVLEDVCNLKLFRCIYKNSKVTVYLASFASHRQLIVKLFGADSLKLLANEHKIYKQLKGNLQNLLRQIINRFRSFLHSSCDLCHSSFIGLGICQGRALFQATNFEWCLEVHATALEGIVHMPRQFSHNIKSIVRHWMIFILEESFTVTSNLKMQFMTHKNLQWKW